MEILKTCPFCGGKASLRTAVHGMLWVGCNSCQAQARVAPTRETAMDLWNRRALEDEPFYKGGLK